MPQPARRLAGRSRLTGRGIQGPVSRPVRPISTAAAAATRTSTSRSASSGVTRVIRFIRTGTAASSHRIVSLQRPAAASGDLQRGADPPGIGRHHGHGAEDRARCPGRKSAAAGTRPARPSPPGCLRPPQVARPSDPGKDPPRPGPGARTAQLINRDRPGRRGTEHAGSPAGAGVTGLAPRREPLRGQQQCARRPQPSSAPGRQSPRPVPPIASACPAAPPPRSPRRGRPRPRRLARRATRRGCRLAQPRPRCGQRAERELGLDRSARLASSIPRRSPARTSR